MAKRGSGKAARAGDSNLEESSGPGPEALHALPTVPQADPADKGAEKSAPKERLSKKRGSPSTGEPEAQTTNKPHAKQTKTATDEDSAATSAPAGNEEHDKGALPKRKAYSDSEMDSILARHCEHSAVKFSEAMTMFDIHEERCDLPPVTQHTTNQLLNLLEAHRDGERRRQIAILKDLGFEFNTSIAEVDQTSVGRIWLQCELHKYSP